MTLELDTYQNSIDKSDQQSRLPRIQVALRRKPQHRPCLDSFQQIPSHAEESLIPLDVSVEVEHQYQ